MTSHVLIRGVLFLASEKAPYVPSGRSVLGALEYDRNSGRVKCHECGQLHKGLGHHVFHAHHMLRRDYNERHGLRLNSALSSLSTREKHRKIARAQNAAGRGLAAYTQRTSPTRRTTKGRCPTPRSYELLNERAECAAQVLYRLQVLACRKGATPTVVEMEQAGISIRLLQKHFGGAAQALRIVGLVPNRQNGEPNPIPEETKAKFEGRMPWPKDYFGSWPFEQKRA